jgi:hypothetical protein
MVRRGCSWGAVNVVLGVFVLTLVAACDSSGGGEAADTGGGDAAQADVPVTPDTVTEDTGVLTPDTNDNPRPDVVQNPDVCAADCSGRLCGDDGCGGSCGTCNAGQSCQAGQCVPDVCVPSCAGGPCTSDGCGGRCGGCPEGQGCAMTGGCAVLMDCADYAACLNDCEQDDALCTDRCDSNTSFEAFDTYGTFVNCLISNCSQAGDFNACVFQFCSTEYYACYSGPENCGWLWGCSTHCEPFPACVGDCLVEGTEAAQEEVVAAINCVGEECQELVRGTDCWNAAVAEGGACYDLVEPCAGTCTPDCDGKECGGSGCGYDCGTCEVGFICNAAYSCEVCNVACGTAVCGPSNCPGIDCGACEPGELCRDGGCVDLPNCEPEDAQVVTCDMSVTGNNAGGTNLFSRYACVGWDEGGPERIYSFTATADDTVTIAFAAAPSADLDIFVLDSTCTAESCVAVGDNGLQLEVLAGETYYVVVDGYQGATASYTLGFDCAATCPDPACGERNCGPAPGAFCAGVACGTCDPGWVCENGTCTEVNCDVTGFTAVEELGDFNAAQPRLARYFGFSSAGAPTDLLQLELWFDLPGAPRTPGSYPIPDENYATCALCLLGSTACNASGNCAKTFLASAGVLELTEVPNAVGGTLGGTVSDVVMREVTINAQTFESTVVPGGQTWCIEGYSFQVTVEQAQ